jgi:NADH-quinone oxidoreductase subunit E
MTYTDEQTTRLAKDATAIIARYPQARSALLPLLHLVQSEDGFVSPDGMAFCASQLGISTAEVSAVATFYTSSSAVPPANTRSGSAPTRCVRSWAATWCGIR